MTFKVSKTCCDECRYLVVPDFCLRRYLCPCHLDEIDPEDL
ncbi:hypothetical protein SEA_BAILEYBLU_58 [Arthrobacter phage BaileyBlu]|uniref:Uncharacterized protein n=1 Tax=Arthrobacter phage BaileyBlu TaxID=2910754 RepID=A0AA49GZF1_9CAUD|nr:hypothetical protein PQD78_gp58 [Arthrobacter phage BaileyBlu]UJQ87196.1 hypothetical protein SEA_BAILEYBLU_58 [Arthrobacter phage BaileyBlu]